MDESKESLAQDLPQELLGEIFVRCLPEKAFQHIQPNPLLPPLVFCHVCSSWRKAALGTPQLWCELSIELACAYTGRLHTASVLRKSLDTLEFWGAHMRSLLPSIHLLQGNSRIFVSHEETDKIVTYQTFFTSPILSSARSLTLDRFYNFFFSVIFRSIISNALR